ncbi:MAG: Rrf2 family transcriptional regulator [Fimbriimonadaceae bacterium]|nr:Rrf2 family transcriptional regulator [Chthonomonadaceae bacterium]MCO5298078.1 Rrf2 family transcriptional regulator [Fimbriimonadaceae bacterium]
MKFSAQEEYGLRCLMAIGRSASESTTIAEIARDEGLTEPYVAKLVSALRKEGFLRSIRGQSGGYALERDASQIVIADVLNALGGRLYEPGFCDRHSGLEDACTHTDDCALRPLWRRVQFAVDRVLHGITLADLLAGELDKTEPIRLASGGTT